MRAAVSLVMKTETVAVWPVLPSFSNSVTHLWEPSQSALMASPMTSPTTCTVWLSKLELAPANAMMDVSYTNELSGSCCSSTTLSSSSA